MFGQNKPFVFSEQGLVGDGPSGHRAKRTQGLLGDRAWHNNNFLVCAVARPGPGSCPPLLARECAQHID
jgi:hypothetical protein